MKKYITLVLVGILISICLLFITERWIDDYFLQSLFNAIAVSGIISSIFTITNNKIERGYLNDVMKHHLPILYKLMKNSVIDYGHDYFFEKRNLKMIF